MTFKIGTKAWIKEAVVDMFDDTQPLATQLLYNEDIEVLDNAKNNLVKIRNLYDGYEGYIPVDKISTEPKEKPTHHVIAAKAFIYSKPEVKTKPVGSLPFMSDIACIDEQENGFIYSPNLGWIYHKSIAKKIDVQLDYVETAKRFLNTPYLYGGRSMSGIDCSAFVQLCLKNAGIQTQRDAWQQVTTIGELITSKSPVDLDTIDLVKGDIVFFKGHVGIMVDHENMIHANATAMCVSVDHLKDFVNLVNLPVTAVRRIIQ